MTKIIKWYQRMDVWQLFTFIFFPIATTAEVLIVKLDGHWFWHLFVAGFGGLVAYVKIHAKDENNNGQVDLFEKPEKKKPTNN